MADLEALAERIVAAMVKRAEQDPGMTFDQVQRLLVLRVRQEAEEAGVRPRELMGAVWRAWERHNRPPMLGDAETDRIIQRLVEKGILRREQRADGTSIVLWAGLTGEDLEARLRTLDHEEHLFVRAIIQYFQRYGTGPR